MKKFVFSLLALFTWAAQAQYIDANGREWMRVDKTFSFAASLLSRCTPNCSGIVTQYDYDPRTHSSTNPRQISLDGYVLASQAEAQELLNSVSLFTLGTSGYIATTYSYSSWVYAYTSSKNEASAPVIAYAVSGHAMVSAYFDQGFTASTSQGPIGALLYRSRSEPKNCAYNGKVLSHGASFTAFKALNVAYNQSCQSEVRTCTDGVLSGTFTAESCVVATPKNCTYNGQTVLHGQSVSGYSSATAANLNTWGTFCSNLKVTRVCTNGSLGGAIYPTCTQTSYNPNRCEIKEGALKCKTGKPIILSSTPYY